MKPTAAAAAAAAPKAMVSSSPGRAEKLPAPGLSRLLFNNTGSRSSRGARSSPMFVSRTKSVGRSASSAALSEGTEPSSPKVTCIGQVRIGKKKNSNNSSNNDSTSNKSIRSGGCRCLERALRCKLLSRRKRKKNSSSSYKLFFFWRKTKTKTKTEEKAPAAVAFVREMEKIESESEEEEEEGETKGFVVSSSTAPKNALLLMRCRSAPHNRSSALALCRFPVSPVPAPESEEQKRSGDIDRKWEKMTEEKGGEPCNGSSKDDKDQESRCSPARMMQQQPAGLMRCKSEPARKAEKLMEASFPKLNGKGLRIVQEAGPTPSPPATLLH